MKIIFFGLGSIGQRHLRLIQNHYPQNELFAMSSSGLLGGQPDVQRIYTWQDVERIKPDVAFICNPTHCHIDTALRCANIGVNLFIEKPLGVEYDEKLDNLKDVVKRKGLTAYVAYPFRYCDKVKRAKEIISHKTKSAHLVCLTDVTRWGKEYSRRAKTGGGAILELSHEIDMAQFLFGQILEISGYAVHTANKFTDAETRASFNCFHESGFVSSVILDILSPVEERYISIDGNRVHLKVSESMYVEQLKAFFDGADNFQEAVDLFKVIVDFKKRAISCRF